MDVEIRKMALGLLGSECGVNGSAYGALREQIVASGNEDILEYVDAVDDQFFIDPEDMMELTK